MIQCGNLNNTKKTVAENSRLTPQSSDYTVAAVQQKHRQRCEKGNTSIQALFMPFPFLYVHSGQTGQGIDQDEL